MARMTERFPRSLVFRTGLTLAAIVLLAIVNIVASIVVADQLEGDAEAINVAGSLRMQAYRIALVLDEQPEALAAAIAGFEARLASAPLRLSIGSAGQPALAQAHAALEARWHGDLRPLLADPGVTGATYRAHVDGFVADVDHFVQQLQHVSEDKIRWLRGIQGLAMFFTLALVFGAMYGLITDVINPLYALVAAARATGRGDLSVRVEHTTDDELGVLGQAFNTMADGLSRVYGELEERVAQKTDELRRNNEALAMLYRLSHLLAAPGSDLHRRLPRALGMLAATLDVRPAFFGSAGHGEDFRIVTPDGDYPSTACLPEHGPGTARAADPLAPGRVIVFPVATHARDYGRLCVETAGGDLPDWALQVLRSAAEILGTALSLDENEQDQRRLLLMEERAVIARELHDSLAQSLSYLKIQVSRLDSLLARGAGEQEIRAILDDLREGLNSAYRQLRELLTTFRLRIEGEGLDAALAATVEEFRTRGLEVRLDYRLQHCPLLAAEEIHVLHAVREALANVARHAGATLAQVSLHQRADGSVEAVVEDDGSGMPPHTTRRQHHGLVIMRERAATLGGDIRWEPARPHGTRVVLTFRPAHLQEQSPA